MKWETPKLIGLTDPQAHGRCNPGSGDSAWCTDGNFPGDGCSGGNGYNPAQNCTNGNFNANACSRGILAGGGCGPGSLG